MSFARGVPRALGHLGGALVEAVVVWTVLAPGLAVMGVGIKRMVSAGPSLGAVASSVIGAALTSLAGVVVARPLASVSRRRLLRGRSGRGGWLQARSLAWLAATLTVRSAALACWLLIGTTAVVGVSAPLMVSRGDRVDIGPWRIESMSAAVALALGAVLVLATGLLVSPALVRAERKLALAVLEGDQAELEQELAETATSRARIVDAHALERRRIERDLHDGVQPEILGVAMTLGLALATMDADDPARELVVRAQQESLDALESLRRFVRGVHPQVLDDHGLAAALAELAGTLPTPIRIESRLDNRLPGALEANLYYASAELLTNVNKHAEARQATVTIERVGDELQVTVEDDGRGGAEPHGRGLTGVGDRLAAIGGQLHVHSPAGGPTKATIRVPIKSAA